MLFCFLAEIYSKVDKRICTISTKQCITYIHKILDNTKNPGANKTRNLKEYGAQNHNKHIKYMIIIEKFVG